jgi:3-phenylpropionate/trans-cinnamate dioxygenase alpha subunit
MDGGGQVLGPVFTVFPNVSFNCSRYTVRIWHPRGPEKTETWAYCLVDQAAPQEVKDAMRNHYLHTFGPSGNLEQDDMNNWFQSTQTALGVIAKKYPMNLQLALNHEEEASVNETGQRSIYHRWAKLMDAPSWSAIKDWDQLNTSRTTRSN